MKIKNQKNEDLDTLVEGPSDARITIVFVHGFDTDKHETVHYFDEISNSLNKTYRIVRFDFSGYGKSTGRQEDFDYRKGALDLKAVLDFVKKNYKGKIHILAQAMGTFITARLSPSDVTKIVFTGIPNSNTKFVAERFLKRFMRRQGSSLDKNGVSLLPRSSGAVTRVGPSFWKELESLDPIAAVSELVKKTKLIIFRPMQDEVVGNEFMEEYKKIPKLKMVELAGDHSFKNKQERRELINRIKDFFNHD